MSLWKQRSPVIEKIIDGVPMIIVEEGKPLKDRMNKARVDEDDVLTAETGITRFGANGSDQVCCLRA